MKVEKFNVIFSEHCSYCDKIINSGEVACKTYMFIRRAKKKNSPANKTIKKTYHEKCYKRKEKFLKRRAYKASKPVGNFR